MKLTSAQVTALAVLMVAQPELEIVERYEAELYEYFTSNGEMPYGVAKARDGDPSEWIAERMEALGTPDNDYKFLSDKSLMNERLAIESSIRYEREYGWEPSALPRLELEAKAIDAEIARRAASGRSSPL